MSDQSLGPNPYLKALASSCESTWLRVQGLGFRVQSSGCVLSDPGVIKGFIMFRHPTYNALTLKVPRGYLNPKHSHNCLWIPSFMFN